MFLSGGTGDYCPNLKRLFHKETQGKNENVQIFLKGHILPSLCDLDFFFFF
jgi:hypothetical protein